MQASHKAVVGAAKILLTPEGDAMMFRPKAAACLEKNGECIVSAQEAVYVIV